MLFKISKVSDKFMDRESRSAYPPHSLAAWDESLREWVMDFPTVQRLLGVCKPGERLLIVTNGQMPSVEIDDLYDWGNERQ